jgi:dienelactone hydrolase
VIVIGDRHQSKVLAMDGIAASVVKSAGFGPFLDGYYDGRAQLRDHVYRRTDAALAASHARNDALTSAADVAARQAEIRAAAAAGLGGLPQTGTPLEPEVVGEVAGDGFTVDKLIFSSLPGYFVTANLYRPADVVGPTAAVLFVCGHSDIAKAYPRYQSVCSRLARNGLIALAIDPIGQGERISYLGPDGEVLVPAGTTEHTYAGVQCWWRGQSIARYFVHDIRRAVDYLVSRPDVDPDRIGITGNSGGGTQTTLAMMLEPRLAAAAPGTFVMSRRDYQLSGQAQDAEQILLGGTAAGIDHEDFLIAMAPRPLLVLAANYDFFPIEGAMRSVERARRAYEILGRPDALGIARVDATHGYHPELAKAATEFFVRTVGDSDRQIDHREPALFTEAELACTTSGQIALDRAQARRVFDLNLAGHRSDTTDWSAEQARDWLAQQVNAGRRPPAEFFPRWLERESGEHHAFWWSEQDLLSAAVLFPAGERWSGLVVTVFDRGTEDLPEHADWIAERVAAGESVLALDVRGVGALAPHPVNPREMNAHYGTMYKLLTDLLWLGDSLTAGRVYDVTRAVEFARVDPHIGLGERPLRLYGAGLGALYVSLGGVLTSVAVECGTPPLDLESILAERMYGDDHRSWQALLPGGARPLPALLR